MHTAQGRPAGGQGEDRGLRPAFSLIRAFPPTLAVLFIWVWPCWAQEPLNETLPVPAGVGIGDAVGILAETAAAIEAPVGPDRPFTSLATPISVDPLFGTATTEIPIEIPPNRKGVTPRVALRYSSNGEYGPYGLGWALELGCVRRNTSMGVPLDYAANPPTYSEDHGFVLTFNDEAIHLDQCLDSPSPCILWRADAEATWLNARFDRASNTWEVTDKRGWKYTYGATFASRVGWDVTKVESTFAWHLTKVVDPNSNSIVLSYLDTTDGTKNEHAYPDQVQYGGNSVAGYAHIFRVQFAFGQNPVPRTNYRAGFARTSSKSLAGIAVWLGANKLRQYNLTYEAAPDTDLLLLAAVSLIPEDPNIEPPPSTTFEYGQPIHTLLPPVILPFDQVPSQPFVRAAYIQQYGGAVQAGFVDVNGDGSVDYVDGLGGGGGLALYQNDGNGAFANVGLWSNAGLFASNSRQLVDMTGDGLPDIVKTDACETEGPGLCTWEVQPNDGGVLGDFQFWGAAPRELGPWVPQPIPPAWSNTVPAQLIDLNGDMLPDILNCADWTSSNPYCLFHRNRGSIVFDPGVSWHVPETNNDDSFVNVRVTPLGAIGWLYPAYTGEPLTSWGWQDKGLVDLNGDSLPDLVNSNAGPDLWEVAFNNGSGFDAVVFWPVSSGVGPLEFQKDFLGCEDTPEGIACATVATTATNGLEDVNGDGLPDYLRADSDLSLHVCINTGAGFGPCEPWAGHEIHALSFRSTFARELFHTPDALSAFLDVNGDHLPEFVRVTDGNFSASFMPQTPTHRLVRQENGMGGSWQVEYAVSNGAGSPLPFPVWTVSRITAASGLSGAGHSLVTDFEFSSGFFDPVSHEFRGFRQSQESRQGDTRTIAREFAPPRPVDTCSPWENCARTPSSPFKLVREQIADGSGRILREKLIEWETVDLDANGIRVQIHPASETTIEYGSGDPVTSQTLVKTFNQYDIYNNPTSETVTGDGISTVRTTRQMWFSSLCHQVPQKITVSNAGGTALEVTELTYDAKCNLLTITKRLAPAGGDAAAGTAVRTAKLVYATTIDAKAAKAGLPTKFVDAKGNTTKITYSCSEGIFPCDITNPLGHVTSRTYFLAFGRVATLRDANFAESQQETTFTYDALGRLTEIRRPLDSLPAMKFAYDFGILEPLSPSRVETKTREPNHADGYRTTAVLFDGLGRELQAKAENLVAISSGMPSAEAETTVTEAVLFDPAGRVAKRMSPYPGTLNDWAVYDLPDPNGPGSELAYDALDRIVSTTNPDGSRKEIIYDSAGVTETHDENYVACGGSPNPQPDASCPGKKTVERRDALGRVMRLDLYEGAETLIRTTLNGYDELDRLRWTVNVPPGGPGSSSLSFDFDSLGRLTAMNDQNSGIWRYDYDDNGNRVFVDDPRAGQHVELCYDKLDRVVRKASFNNDTFTTAPCGGAGGTITTYTYDSHTGCNLGKGRLCRIDVNGRYQATLSYDARGRRTTSAQSITRGAVTRSYALELRYDVADRVKQVKYPTDTAGGAEWLAYGYNFAGQLVKASSTSNVYVQSAAYDRFGRLTHATYGPNVLQNRWVYSQDPADAFRLEAITVENTGGELQHFGYGPYDRAGNLLGIDDTSPIYADASSRDNDWTFGYDGLGRLRSAWWGGATVDASFDYDHLDNMTEGNLAFPYTTTATTVSFAPGLEYPHHISDLSPSSGGVLVQYEADGPGGDGNGGLVSRPATVANDLGKSEIVYDVEGRVASIAMPDAAGTAVASLYDDDGRRIVRSVSSAGDTEVTFYFDRYFEVTENTLTRHIYFGARRIGFSPVAAPPALTLAAVVQPQGATMFAALGAAAGSWAIATTFGIGGSGILLLAFATLLLPGRVRVGMLGRLPRGLVAGLVVILGVSLTLSPLLTGVAEAGCGGGGDPTPPTPRPVYLVHTDHLGSTAMLTAYGVSGIGNGAVVELYRYGPYGAFRAYAANGTVVTAGAERTDVLYTGQRWDAATQVYYFEARYYDPHIARFLTIDPAQSAGGPVPNPYAYAAWNPLLYIDPSGEVIETAVDLVSIGFSLNEFVEEPSLSNAAFLAADVAAAAVPFVPAVGIVRAGGRAAGVVDSAISLRGTANAGRLGRAGESGAGAVTTAKLDEVFHFTQARNADSIAAEGLITGREGVVFATPTRDLSPVQAQLDLALPPNRGLPDAVFRIDLNEMRRLGIEVSGPRQVGRAFNLPGGGTEVLIRGPVPPSALERIR